MTDSPTSAFLAQLKAIDRKGLTVRDAMLLHSIIQFPGQCGLDACRNIGIANRSSVASCFPRMIKLGLIEDRRDLQRQAVPSHYYATAAGIEFWREIAPQD